MCGLEVHVGGRGGDFMEYANTYRSGLHWVGQVFL